MRIEYLEQSTVDRAIVSRQEAVICDLENKTEFQKVQIKRFEVPVGVSMLPRPRAVQAFVPTPPFPHPPSVLPYASVCICITHPPPI